MKRKKNSGIWIRVGSEDFLLEDMTTEERLQWMCNLSVSSLMDTINYLCKVIKDE